MTKAQEFRNNLFAEITKSSRRDLVQAHKIVALQAIKGTWEGIIKLLEMGVTPKDLLTLSKEHVGKIDETLKQVG